MSPLALYRQMIASGMDEATAYGLAAEFEADETAKVEARYQELLAKLASGQDKAAQRRREWDRQRKAEDRAARRVESTGHRVDTVDSADGASPVLPPSPKPPSTNLNLLPSEPKGSSEKTTRARKGPPAVRSRRCPNLWMPSDTDMAMARREGFTPGEIDRELAKIRDYEFRDAHSDWSAVFRNWIRKAAENRPRQGPRHDRPDQPSAKLAGKLSNLERSQRGAQAVLARERL